MQKKIGVRIQAKWVRSGPKLSFLSFFHVWFISFPGNCIGCDKMERFLTTNRGKTHEKNLGPQIGSEIRVFIIFSRLHQFSLILPKITAWDNA